MHQTHQVPKWPCLEQILFYVTIFMLYVQQLMTPATHVSLVKLFNLGHYYDVFCRDVRERGGVFARAKKFPKHIITQRCLTEAHLYPIIYSGCHFYLVTVLTSLYRLYRLDTYLPILHRIASLVPKPRFSSVAISHAMKGWISNFMHLQRYV